MKVSIVIPMYNEETYIGRCLESLSLQTFKDFEIILIDDGSKDKTIEIAQKFEDRFDLTILKQEHGGPGKARNRGAQIAKGEIIVFVDADMKFDQSYIKELIQPIIDGKEIGANHGWEYVANLENPIARAYCFIRGAFDPNHPYSGVFRAVDKQAFLNGGGFDTSKGYSDDNLGKIGRSLNVEKAIAYHNNPESLSEVFSHSIWVGSSLFKTGEILHYLRKYLYWVVAFAIISILVTIIFIYNGLFWILPLSFVGLIAIFVLIKGVQRTIREGYISHLIYVPLVMITRGLGYIYGGLKYLILRRIY